MRSQTPLMCRLAACSLAAAMALSPVALAQDPGQAEPPKQQKVPPLGRTEPATPGVPRPEMVEKDGAAMPGMAGNMRADQTVNSQLLKYAASPDTTGDPCFALKASAGNMTEVEASRVIVDKATDPQVKQLAQTILDEHQKAQDKLTPIAKKLGVMLPDQLPTMHQAEVNTLKNLSPDMAEKAYLSMMKAEHLKAVSMYTDKAPMLKDADLKAYATETLPHIRAHTAKILAANEAKGMPLDTHFKDAGMNAAHAH